MNLVYRHENLASVHSAKNILEMNGISCFLKNEHGSTMGAEFGILNMAEVWITNPDKLNQASSLIKEQISDNAATNNSVKKSWVCANCDEKNESNFNLCWNCQSQAE